MSSILVPVDFSLPCHNAYRYALHLADHLKKDVVLVHYYGSAIDPNKPLVFAGDGSIHGSHIERLRYFAYPNGDGVDYPLVEPPRGVKLFYETEVSLAFSASIIRRAQQDDIDMVVMAPKSSKAVMGKWLGSTATTVSESCDRPVLIVPPDSRYAPLERIVVANNHVTADPYPLWQLKGLAELYGSTVHFVHVDYPDQYAPLRFVPWRLMEQLVEKEPAVDYPFEVAAIEAEDVTQGLMQYADTIHADLIVVVNKLRSRWRSLLRASLTQDMALRTDKPLLVLHTERPEAGDKTRNT